MFFINATCNNRVSMVFTGQNKFFVLFAEHYADLHSFQYRNKKTFKQGNGKHWFARCVFTLPPYENLENHGAFIKWISTYM